MNELTVLYDAHCGLCRRVKEWLQEQPAYVPLRFVPAGSDFAQSLYPTLDPFETQATLTVVSDDGRVYQADAGFVMCLYALVDYREWSLRLATAWGRPLLRLGIWLLERLRKTTICDGACGVPQFEVLTARPDDATNRRLAARRA